MAPCRSPGRCASRRRCGCWRHPPAPRNHFAVNLSSNRRFLVLVAESACSACLSGARSSTRGVTDSCRDPRNRFATIADPPEWGGLLANARTIESLWTTRWLFLIPGIAFAVTAVAVAIIGFALARRYARRDLTQEVCGRGAAGLAVAVLALFVASTLVPERYAEAREWASAARAEVRSSRHRERLDSADCALWSNSPCGVRYTIVHERPHPTRVAAT